MVPGYVLPTGAVIPGVGAIPSLNFQFFEPTGDTEPERPLIQLDLKIMILPLKYSVINMPQEDMQLPTQNIDLDGILIYPQSQKEPLV